MTELDLQKACRIGDCSSIKEVLKNNPALLNELDKDLGWPPLYRTVICGHLDASKELLKCGANPNIKNKLGDSPLHQAVESNQISVVQLLLDYGADTNVQQNDGDTPLHYSCLKEFLNISTLLLKYRANPNTQDFVFGKTPLHIAIECKNVQLLQILVKYSARNDVQDFSGRTPLDISEELRPYLMIEKEQDSLSKKTPSFDFSEISGKLDSIIEPEGENPVLGAVETVQNFSFGTDPHKNSMYKWLTSMKLEFLFGPLYSNGYDDLDFLIAQIRSNEPLTSEVLEEIGIKKVGHRLKLLALLDEEAFKDIRQSIPVKQNFLCINKEPEKNLDSWLNEIGLKKLLSHFIENGIEDWEELILIMQSKYALNDEGLKNFLGIEKMGHRQRILNKLREEMGHIRHKRAISRISLEKDEPITACEFCTVL